MAAAASDIDGLFQLPPDEFTAARNALAAQLKKAGRGDEADRVKALAKPPVSAWTVNQLYWHHRKAFDRLLAVGERFKKAQAAQLEGRKGDLREPLEARRQTLAELSKLAATVLRDAGHNPSPDTMRRVTTTLEALATYGTHPGAPPAGRLTEDVDPPGFEAVAALIPHAGRGLRGTAPTRVIPFQQRELRGSKKSKASPEELEQQRDAERKAQLAAAKTALQEAERTLRAARKSAEQAEAALKKAAGRAKEAEKAKADLEKRWEKVVAEADATRQDARRVASEAEDAAQGVEDAERALEKARKDLDSL
jgi:phage-related minor tail protein